MQIAILSFFHYFSHMFKKRESIFEVEEGKFLSPKFDGEGLIPVVTTDYKTGEVLMHGYMNEEALKKT
jgi:phosphoribosyl-AMP cyclohydrolase